MFRERNTGIPPASLPGPAGPARLVENCTYTRVVILCHLAVFPCFLSLCTYGRSKIKLYRKEKSYCIKQNCQMAVLSLPRRYPSLNCLFNNLKKVVYAIQVQFLFPPTAKWTFFLWYPLADCISFFLQQCFLFSHQHGHTRRNEILECQSFTQNTTKANFTEKNVTWKKTS